MEQREGGKIIENRKDLAEKVSGLQGKLIVIDPSHSLLGIVRVDGSTIHLSSEFYVRYASATAFPMDDYLNDLQRALSGKSILEPVDYRTRRDSSGQIYFL